MEYIGSYLLYFGCFIISIFWSWQYDKKKNKPISRKAKIIYAVLIMLPIVILQGGRYEVGTDYFNYVDLYRGFSQGNELYVSYYINEPLFIIFCRLLYSVFGGNPHVFFTADAIIMNAMLFLVFDYYKKTASMPWLYFFYYMFCFPYFLNVERQGIAVIIIWYSLRYVKEKKLLKFLICILIATLLHNTAIIGLILYVVNFIMEKYSTYMKRGLILVAALSPFIFGVSVEFLSAKFLIFRKYTKFLNDTKAESINTNFIFFAVMLVVLFVFGKILKKIEQDSFWIWFLCVAQTATYLLNMYIDWGFRMSFYFEIGIMYAYSAVIPKIKNRTNYLVLLGFTISMLLFYFTYKFYIQGTCEIFPYKFGGQF